MFLGLAIALVLYFVVLVVFALLDSYIISPLFENGFILSINKNLYILSAITITILVLYYFSYTIIVKKLAQKPTLEIDEIGHE